MKAIKVLMVTPSYHPIIGGTETMVRELCAALNKKKQVTADVLTLNMDKKWRPRPKTQTRKINAIKVIRWGAYRFPVFNIPIIDKISDTAFYLLFEKYFNIHFIPKRGLNKILSQYDIIHYHDDVDFTFAKFTRKVNRPKIFHFHTLFMYDFEKLLKKNSKSFKNYIINLFNSFLSIFDRIIVNSEFSKSLMLKTDSMQYPPDKIAVVHNGVNTSVFRPRKIQRSKNTILFVGRFEERKGIEMLLQSLKHIPQKARLVIIGPKSHDDYEKKIISMIKQENSNGMHEVQYAGPKSPQELPGHYSAATVFVCPSLFEPFGITNIEAMACGTPVVASNRGGIPEIVENNRNGLLVEPTPQELAKAVSKILGSKQLSAKLSAAGMRTVNAKFSIKEVANKLLAIYTETIASQSPK
jgi:glycosyltransferase involved in cell wall biosynthesis